MKDILPLFKSQYSVGRSILTLEIPDKVKEGETKEIHPDSIFEILEENSMDEFFLVDDSLNGFLQAQVNSKKLKKKLMFGVRVTVLDKCDDKTEESRARESRAVIFCHNKKGYQELIKLWSQASQKGFYYRPRIDDSILAGLDKTNLSLMIPFYDSFIYKNNFECGAAMPSFITQFNGVSFAVEQNEMPFDNTLTKLVEASAKEYKAEIVRTKTILYKTRADFLSYLTFRCIHNRSSLSKPNLDHMCSEEFCFESWKEQSK